MSDWVTIPAWDDDGCDNPFPIGQKVTCTSPLNEGRTGTVVSWGRSKSAQKHHELQHVGRITCTYGTSCDYLVDSEGPVVRYNDQDPADESLYWYPGQSMSLLKTGVSE